MRLMLTGRSCSCELLTAPAPRGSLGGRLTEVPCPYFPWVWALRLLVSWMPVGWMLGVPLGLTSSSCPWRLLSLKTSASGGSCSSLGFALNALMLRCQRGHALSMTLCLARSPPWADPGGVHKHSVLPWASVASGGPW